MKVAQIPLSSVTVGDRFRLDYGDITELAESIKANGLITPIAVQEQNGGYLLLAGGRRFRACTELGLTEVPAHIYPTDLGELSARTIEWAENIFRKNLTWQEEVALTQEINRLQTELHGVKTARTADAPGWSQVETAKLLGKDRRVVNNDIKLAEAMVESPELAECQTKTEALQRLARQKEEIVYAEIARRVEAKKTKAKDAGKRDVINSYITGDFFEMVSKLPDRSYSIVEIDPPYAVDLDAVREAPGGGSFKRTAAVTAGATVRHYSDIPTEDYPAFMKRVFTAVYPKVADTGWLLVWFGSSRWHDSIRDWLFETGFTPWRVPAVWTKPTPGRIIKPEYSLGSAYEGFFYAHKTPLGRIVRQGRSNVFHYKQARERGGHPTERPIELLQDILSTFGHPGEKVLVPFLGSGNTLLAASNLNMPAVGFELEPSYRNEFVAEVDKQTHGAYTSYGEAT